MTKDQVADLIAKGIVGIEEALEIIGDNVIANGNAISQLPAQIEQLLEGVKTAITTAQNNLTSAIDSMLNEKLAALFGDSGTIKLAIENIQSTIDNLDDAILNGVQGILDVSESEIVNAINATIENLTNNLATGGTIYTQLMDGVKALTDSVITAVGTAKTEMTAAIGTLMDEKLTALFGDSGTIKTILTEIQTRVNSLNSLSADDIAGLIEDGVEGIESALGTIGTNVENNGKAIEEMNKKMIELLDAMQKSIDDHVTATGKAFATLDETLESYLAANGTVDAMIKAAVKAVTDEIGKLNDVSIDEIANLLGTDTTSITKAIEDLGKKLAEGGDYFNALTSKIDTLFGSVQTALDSNTAAFNTLKTAVEAIESALGGKIDTATSTITNKVGEVLSAIGKLNNLSKEEVGDLVGSVDFTDVINAINAISGKVSANGELYNAIINKVTDLLGAVKTSADNAAAQAQLAAQKATEAAAACATSSANSLLAKAAAEQAQAKAEAALAAAEAAKVAAESLMNATGNAEEAATEAAEAAKLAQAAAEAARDAALAAAEKAQTATVKAHAANVEASLKEWILGYIGALAEEPKQIAVRNAPADNTADAFRAQLDSKLTANYSDENRALILSYYDQAIAQINAATSTAEIDYALETFKANVSLVDSLGVLAPESNDNMVMLLAIIVVVEALIAAAIIVGLVIMLKKKKQNGDDDHDDDDDNSKEEVETEESEEPATEQSVAEEPAVVEETAVTEDVEEVEETEEDEEETEDSDDDDDNVFAGINGVSKTFAEKLAEANDFTKQSYQILSDELMTYKRVSSRLSKKAMSFRVGRVLIVKMTIRGKTLRCYLSLDPTAYEFNKFHHRDEGDKKAYADVPMMMRISSDRAVRRTLRLIADLAEKYGLVKKPVPVVEIVEEELPAETEEVLMEEPVMEEAGVEDEMEEVEDVDDDNDDDNDDDEEEETAEGEVSPFAGLKGKSKTFEERLAEADEITKANFEAIKAELESYKRVSSRLSKKAMSFRVGRVLVVKTVIRGKTLRCYLSLDPAAYEFSKFHHRDASDKKAYMQVPMMMKVRSGRALKRTIRLISDVAEKFALVKKA